MYIYMYSSSIKRELLFYQDQLITLGHLGDLALLSRSVQSCDCMFYKGHHFVDETYDGFSWYGLLHGCKHAYNPKWCLVDSNEITMRKGFTGYKQPKTGKRILGGGPEERTLGFWYTFYPFYKLNHYINQIAEAERRESSLSGSMSLGDYYKGNKGFEASKKELTPLLSKRLSNEAFCLLKMLNLEDAVKALIMNKLLVENENVLNDAESYRLDSSILFKHAERIHNSIFDPSLDKQWFHRKDSHASRSDMHISYKTFDDILYLLRALPYRSEESFGPEQYRDAEHKWILEYFILDNYLLEEHWTEIALARGNIQNILSSASPFPKSQFKYASTDDTLKQVIDVINDYLLEYDDIGLPPELKPYYVLYLLSVDTSNMPSPIQLIAHGSYYLENDLLYLFKAINGIDAKLILKCLRAILLEYAKQMLCYWLPLCDSELFVTKNDISDIQVHFFTSLNDLPELINSLWSVGTPGPKGTYSLHPCHQCGKLFEAAGKNHHYCPGKCSEQHEKNKHSKNIHNISAHVRTMNERKESLKGKILCNLNGNSVKAVRNFAYACYSYALMIGTASPVNEYLNQFTDDIVFKRELKRISYGKKISFAKDWEYAFINDDGKLSFQDIIPSSFWAVIENFYENLSLEDGLSPADSTVLSRKKAPSDSSQKKHKIKDAIFLHENYKQLLEKMRGLSKSTNTSPQEDDFIASFKQYQKQQERKAQKEVTYTR